MRGGERTIAGPNTEIVVSDLPRLEFAPAMLRTKNRLGDRNKHRIRLWERRRTQLRYTAIVVQNTERYSNTISIKIQLSVNALANRTYPLVAFVAPKVGYW